MFIILVITYQLSVQLQELILEEEFPDRIIIIEKWKVEITDCSQHTVLLCCLKVDLIIYDMIKGLFSLITMAKQIWI